MSKLLGAEQRSPRPAQLLVLMLTFNGLTSSSAQGENEYNKLESSRQQKHSDPSEHYEIIVPRLLSGGDWKPIISIYSKSHPAVLKFLIQAEGEQLIISLERNEGLFAGSFTETHYLKDGTAVTALGNCTDHCYYHGNVERYPGSAVSVSTCSGLRGFVSFKNKTFIVEPLQDSTEKHVLYRAEHQKTVPGSCGHHVNLSGIFRNRTIQTPHGFASRHKRDTLKMTKYVELFIVADNREFQRQGKDVEKVKQRLIEIANYVDKFYRPLRIRIALVGVEVWNDVDKCSITQDPFTSLHEFLDWRKLKLLPQKPHDNAQLVSGVYFQGTTIGMAPIMSMCIPDQSGGVVMDHSDSPLGAAVTMAHELGHNFGMNHDTVERGCNCKSSTDKSGCIMTPSAAYPFPTMFSSCSRKDLENSLEKGVGMCLFNMPEVQESLGGRKCGNGYVEEGEECDCGELEECTTPCCNASTCMLKPEAVCAHGLCCENCKLKPAGTPCRETSNFCDLPEFCTGSSPHCPANVYLHDGHACYNINGYCYNGICQTHEQQCITLWGQGAKPAPGICFEKVNSAGDPYGNCGKDSKGSFAKCESRDAKCGKIQCQGGAHRPVIGTNAVSIETNIPLEEGGKILCRGTHVYLGDDMPDPGLVLAGTKCEDGKICLNRKCQNTSVFSVHDCATKCHGRGMCNNKKNCHCEADWAPPYCDKPGFGGSVDSGPVRVADNRSLILGVLGAILCLGAVAFVVYLKRKTLIRLFFANKKTTIEKLRCVSPTRSSSLKEAGATSFSRNLITNRNNSTLPKNGGTRRLPQCQHADISDPVVILDLPQSYMPQRVLPPLHQPLLQQTVPARLLPVSPPLRHIQGTCKPNPPQKPLPADPLNKITQFNNASSTKLDQEPVPHMHPARPAPKHPPQLPRSSTNAYVKCPEKKEDRSLHYL
ncbi:disintegrin and metalloproteinase domain-containing protein 12 [Rhinatrema bivittatum]|uniref:disintegrin and metalloproteinase domain-containing protein 12 n=1 Tax=Rhinatrema bivittatum TaxID=194408 RepID=UPI00112644EB|nr:disintegrin and metalloproteinase domain-containing protein 12 [Rhinatrema bivittatum]